ncbi:DUF4423 domain-containing protein [Bacteriovoracaceae bacterium]|nr:DUF4423 domain-containing protein [Bacteriovoracaceae bacterium]
MKAEKKIKNIRLVEVDIPIFLLLIEEELKRRNRIDSFYSLRAYARDIKIDPSLLSKILKMTSPLSLNNAVKMIKEMEPSEIIKKIFWKSFFRHYQKQNHSGKLLSEQLELFENEKDQELFQILSQPYHYAIVELSKIEKFQNKPWQMARLLGISRDVLAQALDRLARTGFIRMHNDGKIFPLDPRFIDTNVDIEKSAENLNQRKILEKSLKVLDENHPLKSLFKTKTMAIDPKKLSQVESLYRNFIQQLSETLSDGDIKEVYQVQLSLFPF